MLTVTLPWPPSTNTYYAVVRGRKILSAKGRQYRELIAQTAMFEAWPRFGDKRIAVHIEAWVPDKRRRDLDNILKSLLDSLTHAGVWEDDSQIDRLTIERAPMVGGMCKVRVETA